MPELKKYRIFISHAWRYDDEYYRLVKMLNEAPLFDWANYSVPRHDRLDTATDRELTEALHNQIRPTQVVLILAGMYTTYSKWIQKEIDIANGYPKPIVGIKPLGSERIPSAVQEAAIEMVGWNTSSIISAIRGHAL